MKVIDTNDIPFTSVFTAGQALTPSGTTSAQAAFGHTVVYVGGAGDLAFQFNTGGTQIVQTVPAGSWLPIQVAYVNSTATTATNIILFR